MTHDPAFSDPWQKFRWAQTNLLSFHAAANKYLDTLNKNSPAVVPESIYRPEIHGFSVLVKEHKEHPAWWGLWLGDVLNAYRGSLDHLAWALVDRGKRPTQTLTCRGRTRVAFPCVSDPAKSNDAASRKLPGCRPGDLARVKRAQPLRLAPAKRDSHPLTLLTQANNQDKHRTIHPISNLPLQSNLLAPYPLRNCTIRRMIYTNTTTLNEGDEICRVYVKKETRTGPTPAIGLRGFLPIGFCLIPGRQVHETLTDVDRYVLGVLSSFSDPPLNLEHQIRPPRI